MKISGAAHALAIALLINSIMLAVAHQSPFNQFPLSHFRSKTPESQIPPDYAVFPVVKDRTPFPKYIRTALQVQLFGQNVTGSVISVFNPLSCFSYYTSPQGCPGRSKTSVTANYRNCVLATNAGFFNMKTGDCIGNIVSDGTVVKTDTLNIANFGITTEGNYLIGYFNGEQMAQNFTQLLQGLLWLVRDGRSFVNESIKIENPGDWFINVLAPRVAIGHDQFGNLLLVEVNGNEVEKQGLNVWQMTELMIRLGAINAVNLDGGGSATVVEYGQVQSKCMDKCSEGHLHEHCPGSIDRCERAVTTITCVHQAL